MTGKRFTSMYNEQCDMIQYVDTLKEEPNKWSICNVSGTLKKLNELDEDFDDALNTISKIQEENQTLQSRINDYDVALKTLQDLTERKLKENEELKKRNENQYKQLQHLWSLMEAKDWETLSEMVNQMEEDEKRLQQEWKCYE